MRFLREKRQKKITATATALEWITLPRRGLASEEGTGSVLLESNHGFRFAPEPQCVRSDFALIEKIGTRPAVSSSLNSLVCRSREAKEHRCGLLGNAAKVDLPIRSEDFRRLISVCVSVIALRVMGPVRCANGDHTASALHADGSSCFNRLAPTALAGTLSADNISLPFTALDGQVVTFTENSANATFTGTDSKSVGCAASARGRITGINIPYIANQLNGTFTSSAEGILSWQRHRSAQRG
jgi:hypothetical protein